MRQKIVESRLRPLASLGVMAFFVSPSLYAIDLLATYQKAQAYDPAFQAAKADRAVNEADVNVARFSYLPTASLSFGQETTENRPRGTAQIVQPIFDLEKFATYQEAEPRKVSAEANFRLKEQDLASRVLKVVLEVIKTRETLDLSAKQVEALTAQFNRAKRRNELGQGTLLEVRTSQLRLDQARASQRQLAAQLQIVEKQFAAVVGEAPGRQSLSMTATPSITGVPSLASLAALTDRASNGNANIILARASERVAVLAQRKVRAGYLPQVNAVGRSTKVDGQPSDLYTGVQVNIPLGLSVANIASHKKAALSIDRAREQRRGTEENVKLEAERLWFLVQGGTEELAIRREAIASAEFAAEANVKSFEAGLVSSVDVINAILAVFETKRDYLNTLANTTQNLLELQAIAAEPPTEALRRVQTVLRAQ
jgi:protease secretion system outer membrane protein